MGLPEGDPAAHQIIRQVRGQQHGIGRRFPGPGRVHRHGGYHFRIDVQGQFNRINGIEQGFLVFLEVAVVSQGKPFDCHHDVGEVTVQPPRFSAGEFRDIRIFFLGHQG